MHRDLDALSLLVFDEEDGHDAEDADDAKPDEGALEGIRRGRPADQHFKKGGGLQARGLGLGTLPHEVMLQLLEGPEGGFVPVVDLLGDPVEEEVCPSGQDRDRDGGPHGPCHETGDILDGRTHVHILDRNDIQGDHGQGWEQGAEGASPEDVKKDDRGLFRIQIEIGQHKGCQSKGHGREERDELGVELVAQCSPEDHAYGSCDGAWEHDDPGIEGCKTAEPLEIEGNQEVAAVDGHGKDEHADHGQGEDRVPKEPDMKKGFFGSPFPVDVEGEGHHPEGHEKDDPVRMGPSPLLPLGEKDQ